MLRGARGCKGVLRGRRAGSGAPSCWRSGTTYWSTYYLLLTLLTVVLEVEREERHAAVPSEVLSRRASRLDHVAACGDKEWSEHRAEYALCELGREALPPQPQPQRLDKVEQRAVRVPHLLAAGAGVRAWGWGGGEGLGGLGGPGLELGRSLPGLSGQG